MNLTEYCTGIADAIREKEGSTGAIPAPDHAARILALAGGVPTGAFSVADVIKNSEVGTYYAFSDGWTHTSKIAAQSRRYSNQYELVCCVVSFAMSGATNYDVNLIIKPGESYTYTAKDSYVYTFECGATEVEGNSGVLALLVTKSKANSTSSSTYPTGDIFNVIQVFNKR